MKRLLWLLVIVPLGYVGYIFFRFWLEDRDARARIAAMEHS